MPFKSRGRGRLRDTSERGERHDLETPLAESWLSFVMSYGYDVQDVVVIQIDDRKWKTVKHEPAGSVQILGPALWRAQDLTDHIEHGCTPKSLAFAKDSAVSG